jgi:kumamolisin
MLVFVVEGYAQGQSVMTRHLRPEVTSGQGKFLNRVPGTQTLRLDLVLRLRDQAGLEYFLQQVYDPTSPSYRHFLTVPEFTDRFGPSQQDYDAVVGFAKASGLKVIGGSRDGMDVQVEGSVTTIEAAFNVTMGVYQHPTENRTFYAPDREPTVPLAFPLWHISGLDNFSIPHPLHKHRNLPMKTKATTGSGPSASFLGSDMRAAYYGTGPLTGSGQYLGLLEFAGTDLADVTTYFTNAKQTNNVSIDLISTDGTSTSCLYSQGCDNTEQTLDITQAVSMAPGLAALYVFVGSTDTAILSSMSTHSPLAAQLSCSWGWGPADPSTDDPYFEKMAAQGQSFFVAAGDSGKWTKSNYPYPAEDSNVICVGGTDLTTSSAGGAWASETAWADGGGGISPDHIAIPSWQKLSGVITSSNQGSTAYRNGPDVSANANFTYYVCANQTTCTANEYGGTSFAAPLWAGYMALANQQAVANGNAVLGFINPLIYPLGLGSGYDTDFHDITSGTNGYPAVTGYDLATGWGSPNGSSLINALAATPSAPNFAISASPISVSVAQGSSGTSTITTTTSGGFDSAIALSATGQPPGVSAAFSPTSITGAGTSTLTLTVASSTVTGTYTITVAGTSGSITQTTTVTLTPTAPSSIAISSVSPSSVTLVRGGSAQSLTVILTRTNYPGNITLSTSSLPRGVTATIYQPGTGNLGRITLKAASSASTGSNKITIMASGSGVLSATATFTLTVSSSATRGF